MVLKYLMQKSARVIDWNIYLNINELRFAKMRSPCCHGHKCLPFWFAFLFQWVQCVSAPHWCWDWIWETHQSMSSPKCQPVGNFCVFDSTSPSQLEADSAPVVSGWRVGASDPSLTLSSTAAVGYRGSGYLPLLPAVVSSQESHLCLPSWSLISRTEKVLWGSHSWLFQHLPLHLVFLQERLWVLGTKMNQALPLLRVLPCHWVNTWEWPQACFLFDVSLQGNLPLYLGR